MKLLTMKNETMLNNVGRNTAAETTSRRFLGDINANIDINSKYLLSTLLPFLLTKSYLLTKKNHTNAVAISLKKSINSNLLIRTGLNFMSGNFCGVVGRRAKREGLSSMFKSFCT